MEVEYYIVSVDPRDAPLRDYLWHGYESRRDFYDSLRRLYDRWRGRIGERVGERHGFLLLRFHDTPGGVPDEDWLPRYLLEPCQPPEPDAPEHQDAELDAAFGFD